MIVGDFPLILRQWKNKHADGPLNAKKPKKVKERQKRMRKEKETRGTMEDAESSSDVEEVEAEIDEAGSVAVK